MTKTEAIQKTLEQFTRAMEHCETIEQRRATTESFKSLMEFIMNSPIFTGN